MCCAMVVTAKTPCHSTLTETMRAVDADGLAALLGRAIVRDYAPSQAWRPIVIDGKTLRGSKDEDGDAEHCLSAFAHAVKVSDAGAAYRARAGSFDPERAWGRCHG